MHLRQDSHADVPDRRSSGRRLQQLVSSIGQVLDLSGTGMRVMARQRPSGTIDVTLHTKRGDMRVFGRVVWTKRRGFWRHEVGIEFVGLDDETSRALAEASSEHAFARAA